MSVSSPTPRPPALDHLLYSVSIGLLVDALREAQAALQSIAVAASLPEAQELAAAAARKTRELI